VKEASMERVVITGLGIVSSIGIGKEEYWSRLISGRSGIDEIKSIDTSAYANHRGGEIENLDSSPFISADDAHLMERGSVMAVMAAKMALADSGARIADMDRYRIGVCIGTTMGEIQALEKLNRIRVKDGTGSIPPRLFRDYAAVNIPTNVSKALSVNGRTIIIPNACAAGNFAISYAFELVRSQKLDMVFAGGADPFSTIAFTGFNRLGAMAHDEVRSYDRDSKGMMVGEGAGMIVIESLRSAMRRGGNVYAEIAGYGLTCDAQHITAPNPLGMVRAMKMAMERAGIRPDQVDSVIGHGTGTPSNDQAEMVALGEVFGDRVGELPVTSIKSMLGHTMGAASAIESLTNALTVCNDVIPPTINYREPRLETHRKIKIVANQCLPKRINYGMNNALAFGGNNSSLILRKFTEE
jgi:3-oxoacyl-[acyl-carrier-protein] synthase II